MSGALDRPDHVNVPVLDFRGLIAEALERNADLDLVAGVRQPSFRIEDEIGAQIRKRPSAGEAAEAAALSARILQTSTSVGSAAAGPSSGEYCEKPVRVAACCQTGSDK